MENVTFDKAHFFFIIIPIKFLLINREARGVFGHLGIWVFGHLGISGYLVFFFVLILGLCFISYFVVNVAVSALKWLYEVVSRYVERWFC